MRSLADISCNQLQGVGQRTLQLLHKLNIYTVQDLLLHFPLRYEDRTHLTPIVTVRPGCTVQVEGVSSPLSSLAGKRNHYSCFLTDSSGSIAVRFFHLTAAQRSLLRTSKRLRCYGEVRFAKQGGLLLAHPEFQVVQPNTPLPEYLTPVYPTVAGLSQRVLRQLVLQAINLLQQNPTLQGELPFELRKRFDLPTLADALVYLHQLPLEADLQKVMSKQHPMQQRVIMDELLAHQLSMKQWSENKRRHKAPCFAQTSRLVQKLITQLPFTLTKAQQRVLAEIQADLAQPVPMLRLVQGDVGSGKTIVAALAALQVAAAGYQVAIMAPTEILAEQHWRNFSQWLEPLNIPLTHLTGSLKTRRRKQVLAEIQSGDALIVIGTHALFQEHVVFKQLGLIIIDEQHRFGVHQRLALLSKSKQAEQPHQLIMTATPIPRSLAMVIYADLAQSIIDELPAGRKPITTVIIPNERRQAVVARIREQCQQGRQVYWVCPLIETSEVLQCQAAEQTTRDLQAALPELRIGMVHGRLAPEEKRSVMERFKQGELNVLVATTVIEVGVDVPNASLMVIENPERLGLAQLHQLRGRIGRGSIASYCVLLYQAPLSEQAKARLQIMRDSQDGFLIAQRDLELRGSGEFLGIRQSGLMQFKILNLARDQHVVPIATSLAQALMADHRQLSEEIVERWLGSQAVALGSV